MEKEIIIDDECPFNENDFKKDLRTIKKLRPREQVLAEEL